MPVLGAALDDMEQNSGDSSGISIAKSIVQLILCTFSIEKG
jgi:hypothetical protein